MVSIPLSFENCCCDYAKMIDYLTSHHRTCHPERNEVESKDLRTETLLSTTIMRRFFDSAALCAAPLRMTCVLGDCSAKRSFSTAETIPSGAQWCNDSLRTVHELSAGTAR